MNIITYMDKDKATVFAEPTLGHTITITYMDMYDGAGNHFLNYGFVTPDLRPGFDYETYAQFLTKAFFKTIIEEMRKRGCYSSHYYKVMVPYYIERMNEIYMEY